MNYYLNGDLKINNFTLESYKVLLQKTKSKFPIKGFEVLDHITLEEKFALIRHDIDMSIERALKLAKNKALEMKDIKGQYKIIDKKLYLDNLIINSIKFREKILLSSLDKSCTI